ncbi:MAG TPA: hypothetical protein VJ689_00705 [Gaiellaceae bacterium]|nr:hypothetical protein [Gaiellaceae bacterium]
MQTYRLIVISEGREAYTTTVQLPQAPKPGETVELSATGVQVKVRHVGGPDDGVDGVIIAGPGN